MADKLFEDSEFVSKRFSCSCLDNYHILDISVEFFASNVVSDKSEINLCWSLSPADLSLWQRIKKSVKILLGREYPDCNIILRHTDIDELIDLLERAKEKGGCE